jgi:hypothetical protein
MQNTVICTRAAANGPHSVHAAIFGDLAASEIAQALGSNARDGINQQRIIMLTRA